MTPVSEVRGPRESGSHPPEVRGWVHTAPEAGSCVPRSEVPSIQPLRVRLPLLPPRPGGQRFRHHSHSECGSHLPKSEALSTQTQQAWLLPTEVIGAVHTDPVSPAPTPGCQRFCPHSPRKPGSCHRTTETRSTQPQPVQLPPSKVRGPVHTAPGSQAPTFRGQMPHPHSPGSPAPHTTQ